MASMNAFLKWLLDSEQNKLTGDKCIWALVWCSFVVFFDTVSLRLSIANGIPA